MSTHPKFKVGDIVYKIYEDGLDVLQIIGINENDYFVLQVNNYKSWFKGTSSSWDIGVTDSVYQPLTDEVKAEIL